VKEWIRGRLVGEVSTSTSNKPTLPERFTHHCSTEEQTLSASNNPPIHCLTRDESIGLAVSKSTLSKTLAPSLFHIGGTLWTVRLHPFRTSSSGWLSIDVDRQFTSYETNLTALSCMCFIPNMCTPTPWQFPFFQPAGLFSTSFPPLSSLRTGPLLLTLSPVVNIRHKRRQVWLCHQLLRDASCNCSTPTVLSDIPKTLQDGTRYEIDGISTPVEGWHCPVVPCH
jgi:hypothetical protein